MGQIYRSGCHPHGKSLATEGGNYDDTQIQAPTSDVVGYVESKLAKQFLAICKIGTKKA
jgi:hypothetical protein